MIDRRKFLGTATTAVGGLALMGTGFIPSAAAQSVSEVKLMAPGPIKEMTQGDPDAPVRMIEYASMTCGHCRNFHDQTYPTLKSEYIETGKVYFILREFPLDNVATAVAMLARCAPEEQYFDIIDLFFATQRQWIQTENIVGELFNVSKQVGFSQAAFEACLTNQELLNGIQTVKQSGSEFGVQSTPTFFINGEMVRGALSVDQLREEIDSRL